MTIVGLVEQLGRLLVDPTPSNRELGTWILTRVLETLPPKHFDNAQLKYLCNFYKDRLKDHHQVILLLFMTLVRKICYNFRLFLPF